MSEADLPTSKLLVFAAREIETKETEDVMTLEGPKEKRSKSEPEMVTVKEVCVWSSLQTHPLIPLHLQTCSFCSLQDALSVDWGKKPAKYFRRTPPTFLLIQSESSAAWCNNSDASKPLPLQ